jgi:hypothetical protein
VDVLIATVNEMEINTNKVSKALGLDIPVIAEDWLIACLDKKKKLDWTPYLLK